MFKKKKKKDPVTCISLQKRMVFHDYWILLEGLKSKYITGYRNTLTEMTVDCAKAPYHSSCESICLFVQITEETIKNSSAWNNFLVNHLVSLRVGVIPEGGWETSERLRYTVPRFWNPPFYTFMRRLTCWKKMKETPLCAQK